ncbi:integrase [Cotesia congregata filamentous virus 1]|uniref:Integrase n=1 Tax=Cotesia congregata filamentous virus 1 TaxID=3064291 RepID=A0ABC8QKA1_9VIRU|nr:integrase [Cotesia congregata filamentous virus 1]
MSKKQKFFTTVLHGKKRQTVLSSHLKYTAFLKENGSMADVESLIKHFIINDKTPSYCFAVLISLVRWLRHKNPDYKLPVTKSKVYSSFKMYNKLLTNYGKELYDDTGQRIDWRHWPELETMTRVNLGGGRDKTIKPQNADKLLTFCKDIAEAFWRDDNGRFSKYTPRIEAARIIFYLLNTGFRINELLSLRKHHIAQVLTEGKTTIIGKNGLNNVLYFGRDVQNDIARYLTIPELEQELELNNRAFIYNYQALRRAYRKIYKDTVGEEPPVGCRFHSLRAVFANSGWSIDKTNTQTALRHYSPKMTAYYVKKQRPSDQVFQLLEKIEAKNKAIKSE